MKRLGLILGVLLAGASLFFFKMRPKRTVQPWMQAQIEEDLSHYQKGDFDSQTLKAYFDQADPSALLVFYQIKENQVYWTKNWEGDESIDRLRKTTRMLDRMTKNRQLPDIEFLLTVHDGICLDPDSQSKPPVFCYAKTDQKAGILFPDPLSEAFSRRSRLSIAKANRREKYAWKNKLDIAFWRGGTTGGTFEMDNWFHYPRSKLSLLTKYYPELVDSGFTTFPGVKPEVKHEMEAHLPKVSWTVHKEHLKYKYLVVPDGNTCTYPRYYLGLLSNSTVIKQDSDQVQWFYKGLEPYVHYIPVAHDFSNLPEQVQWAKKNDLKVQAISKQASHFIKYNLMPKHIYDYVETLLIEYQKLQEPKEIHLFEGAQKLSYFKEKK